MEQRKNSINGLLVFLIYGMFALFSLFLVVIGAKVYREVVSAGEEAASVRAAFSYVANKVRMTSGDIYIREQEGIPVLVLSGDGDGEAAGYETRIYYYDGALRESFAFSEGQLLPESGEKIAELSAFSVEETDSGQLLLKMEDSEGLCRTMHLDLNR